MAEELEAEQAYWTMEDAREDYATWIEARVEGPTDFASWPVADLVEELETVRTLTPDQDEIIAELEHEIERRSAA